MRYVVGPWVKRKLNFLKWYLPIHTTEISKYFSQFYYIDGFAGSGKNRIENTDEIMNGSALIALDIDPPFTNYVFMEANGYYFFELREHIRDHPKYPDIQTFFDDCNARIPEIVRKMPSEAHIFAFLDPEGLELHWKTVEELAKRKEVGLLITFSIMGVVRCAQSERGEKALDDFYGTTTWRDIARNRRLRRLTPAYARKAFVNLYKSQLGKHFRYTDDVAFVKTQRGQALYYLVFATRSEALISVVQKYKQVHI